MVSSIYKWRREPLDRVNAHPKALADREMRNALPETRDNTGILLGDPPAGRSALDKKREAEERRRLSWLEALQQITEEPADE